jgi:hypothetical protein
MAEFTADGRIRYRLIFQHAAHPDSEDFTSTQAYEVGDTFDHEGETWTVTAIKSAPAGVSDLLLVKRSG